MKARSRKGVWETGVSAIYQVVEQCLGLTPRRGMEHGAAVWNLEKKKLRLLGELKPSNFQTPFPDLSELEP